MKQDPRPFAFRCSSELRDEIERRAGASGQRASEVIRELLERAVQDSQLDSEAQRLTRLEDSVQELLLLHSQLASAFGNLGKQFRVAVEAILINLDPDGGGEPLQGWLDRRFPPVFVEELAG